MGHCSFIHGSNEERAAARGPEKHIHQEDKRQRHARGEKQGKQWLQPGFPKGGGRAHGRCKRSASNNTTRQAPAQSAQRRQMLGRWESQGCSRGEREPHHHGPLLLVQSPHTQLHYAVVRPLPLYLPSHSGGHHDHFCHPGSASCSAGLGLVLRCAPVLLSLLCWWKQGDTVDGPASSDHRGVGFENRQWSVCHKTSVCLSVFTEGTHGGEKLIFAHL